MKKNFTTLKSAMMLICALLLMQFGFAQRTTIAGWTFERVPQDGVQTYEANCGEGTLYLDGTHGSDEWFISTGTSTQDSASFYYGGTTLGNFPCSTGSLNNALGLVGNGNNGHSVVFTVSTTGSHDIQLSYAFKRTGQGFKTATWAHSIDGVNFTTDSIIQDETTAWGNHSVDFSNVTEINNTETVYIRLTVAEAGSSNGNNRFDNINFTGMSDVETAVQPVFSVAGGNHCGDVDVEITSETETASIYYTLDGSDPDNTSTPYTTAIHIGTTTTLKAIAIADGLANSPVTEATYTFPTQIVSTISDFKALTDNNSTVCKLNCDVTAVFESGEYLLVEDAAQTGLCIYKQNGIGTNFVNGDVITGGICGKKTTYYGLIELKDPTFANTTPTEGTAINPIEVTMAQLYANWNVYDSRLVTLNGVTFQQGTINTSSNSRLLIHQVDDSLDCANTFKTISGFTAPLGTANVTGFVFSNTSVYRIAPRSTNDIVDLLPSITIVSPTEGEIIEEGSPISVDLTVENFNFENQSMIEGTISGNGFSATRYIHNAAELMAFENMDFVSIFPQLPFGEYTLTASLVHADSTQFDPAATHTVHFTYSEIQVAIEASVNNLTFTETGESHTFTVTAHHLQEAITLTADNSAFTVAPATLSATAENATVTVTFNGTASATSTLTLTSGTTTTAVTLNAIISNDAIIYSTGFEVSEGFPDMQGSNANYHNDDIDLFSGPEAQQWGTYHGRVAVNNSVISGLQSMQMRYYGGYANHIGHIGYTYTNFDLSNVTKVEFSAKTNFQSMQVRVSFSHDGGETYEENSDSIYDLSASAQRFTYFISDEGAYNTVRLKFTMVLPADTPTNNKDLILDSVVVYGITGIVSNTVATPVISVPTGTYLTPQTVSITCETEDARIYYTTDGTVPDTSSTLYTEPISIDRTCTLKAKAFKDGMDPSNPATAVYTFPATVANIAAFKAAGANDNTITYAITGDVTFVYRKDRRIFIEDATGGLLVYDNSTAVVTGTYSEGDVISGGIVGTYTVYNGMSEMIPTVDWAAASGTATVTPVVATAADIAGNFATYEARLVRINAGTFAEDITFVTDNYTDGTLTDETGDILVRNQFKTLDTTIHAGDTVDVIGLVSVYVTDGDTTYQIFPRTNEDIFTHSAEIPDTPIVIHTMEPVILSVYPNPTTDVITVNADQDGGSLEVLNAFGQVVYRATAPVYPTTVDLNGKASGLYFVRIITADQRVAVVKVTKK